MVTKIARNVVTYSGWAAMREAVSIAVAGGVNPGAARGDGERHGGRHVTTWHW
jgi:3-hydroxyisobutyrate dehydrogenase-like beta-hydroxyacid dehydrogenase